MAQAAKRPTATEQRGSERQGREPEPRYFTIGQIVGGHGVRGELKVEILTDVPERFGLLDRVLIGREDEEPVSRALTGFRLHHGRALLRLDGCLDRSTAETLRGYLVQIPQEQALPLSDGEYYEHQILNLEAWTPTGEYLGTVVDIIYTGANDVYVVRREIPPRREILVPAIQDVVLEVDLESGRLVVQLPNGLA